MTKPRKAAAPSGGGLIPVAFFFLMWGFLLDPWRFPVAPPGADGQAPFESMAW